MGLASLLCSVSTVYVVGVRSETGRQLQHCARKEEQILSPQDLLDP